MSGAFEGKQVIVLIDMPGTQKGVNIYPQRPNPFDANDYGKQMKGNPVALRVGDAVMSLPTGTPAMWSCAREPVLHCTNTPTV